MQKKPQNIDNDNRLFVNDLYLNVNAYCGFPEVY